jgi:Fur family zinc uptake transcriptional regulator
LLLYKITTSLKQRGSYDMRKQAAVRQLDVLNVLKGQAKPMTAYAILNQMKLGEPDLAAPTVYRALDALTNQGRAHKLESIKAFVPCRCNHDASVPVLAICEECGNVEEHDGAPLLTELSAISEKSRFNAVRHIVEIHGQCGQCTT